MKNIFHMTTGGTKLANYMAKDGECLSAPAPTLASLVAGIVNKLWSAIKARVPSGYQDETGFHYGSQPSPWVKTAGRFALAGAVFGGVLVGAPLTSSAVQSVTLTWNASTSPNIVGYDVYYGSVSGNYTNVISVGNVTRATISGLGNGVSNYFVVKARDAVGLESLPSNEIAYTVPDYVWLAVKAISLAGAPASVVITATGATPAQWALESSSDLKNWSTAAVGTNPLVNVSMVITGTPALFFRLRNE
jgi:hypothetical protein